MEYQESRYRTSRMEFDHAYFGTGTPSRGRLVEDAQSGTIKDWKRLLKPDKYKEVIISSWQELTERKMIMVYGFKISHKGQYDLPGRQTEDTLL